MRGGWEQVRRSKRKCLGTCLLSEISARCCQNFLGLVPRDINILSIDGIWAVVPHRGMRSAFLGRCRAVSSGGGLGAACSAAGSQREAWLCKARGCRLSRREKRKGDNSDAGAYRTGDKGDGLEAQAGQSYIRKQGAESRLFTQRGAMLVLARP